jgi:hypothetical protein
LSIRTFDFVSTGDRTNQRSLRQPPPDPAPAQRIEIRVRGHLGERWSAWFDGMTLTPDDDGTSIIRGSIVDQAALHGLLQKLRDLGITLISLTPLAPDEATAHPCETRNQTSNPTLHHSSGASS